MTHATEITTEAESGFEIAPEYGPSSAPGSYADALGAPGEFPYTRHVRREGYRDLPWQPSLYSGYGDPADANDRFRFLLREGNGRVSIAFDLPTQLGLDSDDPRGRHEVGRVGVAIDSLRDFEVLLDGIPIEDVPVTMNMNAMAPVTVAMLAAVARRRGVPLTSLRGTISNDILTESACRGLCIWDLPASMRLLRDTAAFVIRRMPGVWAFNVRAALLHEIAANPAQELGVAMATTARYIDVLAEHGVPPEQSAARISLFFGSSPKFLEHAAKLRAARRMWARMLRDEYGLAEDARATRLRMTAVACNGSHFVREDPELNLVRSALGVLACSLGGAQTMVGTALDEAYEIPSSRAQELALRVQQVISLESDVRSTVDPLGGSYFLEAMTDRLEAEATAVRRQVDEQWGGIEVAIGDERPQALFRQQAYAIQRGIENGERPVVGVNVHRSTQESPQLQLWEPDPDIAERRVEAIASIRAERDDSTVAAALERLERVARDPQASIMEAMLETVEAYATVGEIRRCLSEVYSQPAQELLAS